MKIAKAANLEAFTWDEIDQNPLLKRAILECIEIDEKRQFEHDSALFKGLGRQIRLLDGIGTLIASYFKALGPHKSMLQMIEPREKPQTPKMMVDPAIAKMAVL